MVQTTRSSHHQCPTCLRFPVRTNTDFREKCQLILQHSDAREQLPQSANELAASSRRSSSLTTHKLLKKVCIPGIKDYSFPLLVALPHLFPEDSATKCFSLSPFCQHLLDSMYWCTFATCASSHSGTSSRDVSETTYLWAENGPKWSKKLEDWDAKKLPSKKTSPYPTWGKGKSSSSKVPSNIQRSICFCCAPVFPFTTFPLPCPAIKKTRARAENTGIWPILRTNMLGKG